MRDPERIDFILCLIKKIWHRYPDLRFNQLLHNLAWDYSRGNNDYGKEQSYSKWENERGIQFHKDVENVDLFYLEDDKFVDFLQNYIDKFNIQ